MVSTNIEWMGPPSDLSDLVHTFYLLDLGPETINEPTPAYSAQLIAYLQGEAVLEYEHGGISQSGVLALNAPQLAAGRMRMTGPVRAVGASLTPLGWAALVGLPVDEVHDCVLPPASFASAEAIADVEAWRSAGGVGRKPMRTGLGLIEAIVRAAPHAVKPQHRNFVERFNAWLMSDLNPPIEALYEQIPFSQRQVQRLSRHFFGATPTQVLMRHRAIRTAMLLSNPDLPKEMHDQLKAAYFDQAHMIRNIRRFTGRTPADLAGPSLAKETLNPEGHGANAEVLREPPE